MHNQWLSCLPSRFINEMPEDNLEINLSHFSGNQKSFTDIEEDTFDQSDYSTPGWERAKIESSIKNLENNQPKIIKNSNAKYSKGSIVIHKKFGQGKVESVDGKKLTIDFGESGTRKVMENFVESLN